MTKRHHCRNCNRLICDNCFLYKAKDAKLSNEKVKETRKICLLCKDIKSPEITAERPKAAEEFDWVITDQTRNRVRSHSWSENTKVESEFDNSDNESTENSPSPRNHKTEQWKLSGNSGVKWNKYNEDIRTTFSYINKIMQVTEMKDLSEEVFDLFWNLLTLHPDPFWCAGYAVKTSDILSSFLFSKHVENCGLVRSTASMNISLNEYRKTICDIIDKILIKAKVLYEAENYSRGMVNSEIIFKLLSKLHKLEGKER